MEHLSHHGKKCLPTLPLETGLLLFERCESWKYMLCTEFPFHKGWYQREPENLIIQVRALQTHLDP